MRTRVSFAVIVSAIVLALVASIAVSQPIPSPGIRAVAHDTSLKGVGTTGSRLGLAACGSGMVLQTDGSGVWQCAPVGSGSGSGITNTAGLNVVMKSDGTNAVASSMTDDGTTVTVGDGVTNRNLYWRGGKLLGYSISGGTLDFQIDPQGYSFLDSAIGPSGHSSGTDETLCIGWICDTFPLKGDLDIRTNGNTINAATPNSGGLHVQHTDTVNTGTLAVESWGVFIEGGQARGTGTGALTSYGLLVDKPDTGQVNYGIATKRGDIHVGTGYNFTGDANLTALAYATQNCTASAAPATLTGGSTTNDWAIATLLTSNCRIRMSSSSTAETIVTGIANPTLSGARVWILDNTGNGPITFKYNNAGSLAGNKFYLENDTDVVLDEWEQAYLIRDPDLAAWRIVGGHTRIAVSSVYKSSPSLDAVASSILDDGTTVSTTEPLSALTLRTGGATGSLWTNGIGTPAGACSVGDFYSNTTGSPGTTIYSCTAANTWTAVGGSGITNTAGANVLMKSDGTNAVASRITDTGSLITTTGAVNISGTTTGSLFNYAAGEATYLRGGNATSIVYIGDSNTGGINIGSTSNTTSILGDLHPSAIGTFTLAASQNDYSPAGFAHAMDVLVKPTANISITGFAAQPDGFEFTFLNADTVGYGITFNQESGSSLITDRLELPDQLDGWIMYAGCSARFRYNAAIGATTLGRWQVLAWSCDSAPRIAATSASQTSIFQGPAAFNGGVVNNLSVGGYIQTTGGGSYINSNAAVYAFGGASELGNNTLIFSETTNAAATGYINSVGYAEGVTQLRDLEIDDGKGSGGPTGTHYIAYLDGTNHQLALQNQSIFLARQVITIGGTYTPTTGTRAVRLRMCGGGGGSGGAKSAASGGGAGGAYLEKWIRPGGGTAITGGAVSPGAAGTAGAVTPTNGGNGGDSTIVIQTVTYTAKGGGGSVLASSNVSLGAAGQSGSTAADVNKQGDPGTFGAVISGTYVSGNGGSSPFGSGGLGVKLTSGSTAGISGTENCSGGGGGADFAGTGIGGGDGTKGLIIVDEYR